MVTARERSTVVDTLTEARKTLLHEEAVVHHLLPVVEPMRVGFSSYLSAICTHFLLAGRDLASLIELVAALPVEDERRAGGH
jgi:3-methyladenine DNA glycosylase/8-oxoguanine DNA glycosylase